MPENPNQVDLSPEVHSPVEEVPVEQTRVYQNQPEDQSPPDPNPPVQLAPWVTPKSPPRPKPGVKKKISPGGSEPDVVGQNLIEEDQRVSAHQGLTNAGLDGNGAIWVSGFTEQPGFLFPVARPTTPTPPRRQITEEASLQVVTTTSGRSIPSSSRCLLSLLHSLLRATTTVLQTQTPLLFSRTSSLLLWRTCRSQMSSTKTPSKTLDSKPLDLLRSQVRLLFLIHVNLSCTSLQLLGSQTSPCSSGFCS